MLFILFPWDRVEGSFSKYRSQISRCQWHYSLPWILELIGGSVLCEKYISASVMKWISFRSNILSWAILFSRSQNQKISLFESRGKGCHSVLSSFEAQQQTQSDNPFAPSKSSSLVAAWQEFHLHTTGYQPRTLPEVPECDILGSHHPWGGKRCL